MNGWTKNAEKLLRNWSQQISINESEYRKRGSYYRNWYYAFGAFIVIAQTGALTTLIQLIFTMDTNADDSGNCNTTSKGLLIFVAGMGILILVAQGLNTFFNFGSGSEQYFEASREHNALSRLIDTTMMLPRNERDQSREVLLAIRQQFDQMQNNCPSLPPNAVIHRLDMCIYDDPNQAKGHFERDVEDSVPENAMQVILPKSPPGESTFESDEEHIGITQQTKLNTNLQKQKTLVAKDEKKKKLMRNLEYQWERMEQHAEDHANQESSEESSLYD